MIREAAGHRMLTIVYDQSRGKWRPAVVVEYGIAEEMNEPGPMCVLVVVAGDVEAQPGAAVFHVLLKGGALGFGMRKIVEPDQEFVSPKAVVAVVPVRRGIEGEVLA